MKKHLTPLLASIIAMLLLTPVYAQRGRGYGNAYPSPQRNGYGHPRDFNRQHAYAPPVVRYLPPAPPRVYRGVAPSRLHVWIASEYLWRAGRYVPVPGYWALPPQRGGRYMEGYWQRTRGGYVWVSGRWVMGGRNRW